MKMIVSSVILALLLCGAAAGSFYPFYENVDMADGSFFAVRPFYSKTAVEGRQVEDFLWPLYSRKTLGDEVSSRALVFWWTHQFEVDSESPRERNWLLPFYFQGTDATGEDYVALFPFGGTIREFLGRDLISFVLFPLFATSQINDVKTTSVLWPIISQTRGEGIERDRIFPFVGRSVLEGKYEKKFVLWPFWNSAEYFYPGDSGRAWMLFPICGRSELEKESTLWVLPPFFRFTDGERLDRMFCPWPFFQKEVSAERDKLWIWPLWGRDIYDNGALKRSFAAWPFLWSEQRNGPTETKKRKMALPFFYCDRTVQGEQEVSSYWKVWPLMSSRKEGDVSRFRMLELWPLKETAPIERNWSPLWTLYERREMEGTVRKRALWFLWNSERSTEEERSEWSLLKGLLSVKKEGDSTSGRFLYLFRFGD
jgi:hypothetical protein